MVQIYCYCYKDKTIWDAYLHYMHKIFIREYGHLFHVFLFEMNDL